MGKNIMGCTYLERFSFGEPSPSMQIRISCHWQKKDVLYQGKRAANKMDAQCDKLATELSWQCFVSKVANLQLPHVHLTYPTCTWRLRWDDPVWILLRFSVSENWSPWLIVWRCLRVPTFSRLSRTQTCDRRTDRQTYDDSQYPS